MVVGVEFVVGDDVVYFGFFVVGFWFIEWGYVDVFVGDVVYYVGFGDEYLVFWCYDDDVG